MCFSGLSVFDPSYLIFGAASFELLPARRQGHSSQYEFVCRKFKTPCLSTKLEMGKERKICL